MEQFNDKGVEVKDNHGQTVYMEDFEAYRTKWFHEAERIRNGADRLHCGSLKWQTTMINQETITPNPRETMFTRTVPNGLCNTTIRQIYGYSLVEFLNCNPPPRNPSKGGFCLDTQSLFRQI
jgi:hypothetical protein